MNIKTLELKAIEISNIVGTSYLAALESMQETAREKKQHVKSGLLGTLIQQEINSSY